MSRARELGNFAGTITASGDLSFDDNTGILDSNGNEIVLFQEVASAVNYLNIGNHSTGNAPYITAGGADTNINVQINPKGSGIVTIGGNEVWHAGNDGPGSGLNADTVDGVQAAQLAQLAAVNTIFTGNVALRNTTSRLLTIDDTSAGSNANPSIRFTVNNAYTTGGVLMDNVNSITNGYLRIWRYNASAVNKAGVLFNELGTIAFNTGVTTKSMTVNGSVIHTDADEGSWIAVTFLNSWLNFGGGWAVAAYRRAADGRIDIHGMVYHTSGTNTGPTNKVFTLPVGYRPTAGHVMFPTTNYSGSANQLWIDTTGQVYFGTTGVGVGSANWHSISVSFYP